MEDHQIFYGGKRRRIRYKEVPQVLWQGGAKRRSLRLFVIAPTPYRKRQSSRLYYRDPAYLLTSVPHGAARALLQIYLDRWQIEVNHREEKDTLGIGQAQLWNLISVPKQPAFAVAAYSALLLASLRPSAPNEERLSHSSQSGGETPTAFLLGPHHAPSQGNSTTNPELLRSLGASTLTPQNWFRRLQLEKNVETPGPG